MGIMHLLLVIRTSMSLRIKLYCVNSYVGKSPNSIKMVLEYI